MRTDIKISFGTVVPAVLCIAMIVRTVSDTGLPQASSQRVIKATSVFDEINNKLSTNATVQSNQDVQHKESSVDSNLSDTTETPSTRKHEQQIQFATKHAGAESHQTEPDSSFGGSSEGWRTGSVSASALAVSQSDLGTLDQAVDKNPQLTPNATDKKTTENISLLGDETSSRNSSLVPYLEEMKQRGMELSLRQQLKFHWNKNRINKQMLKHPLLKPLLFQERTDGRLFGFVLNEKYVFRHIFKNGGSTVEAQVHGRHIPAWRKGKRHILSTVRDPIDHFLSGWGECGLRNQKYMVNTLVHNRSLTYDERVLDWLQLNHRNSKRCKKSCYICRRHSAPQASFLMNHHLNISSDLDLVGDVKDLPQLLELVGFKFDKKIGAQRVATDDETKKKYFPKRKDLLSKETLQGLCMFLALDYFLLDYDPPKECLALPVFNVLSSW